MRCVITFIFLVMLTATSTSAAAQPAPGLFVLADKCLACHNDLQTDSGRDVSIGANWQASMMAHAAKDPYWQASVRRESLDHPGAVAQIEDECAACHMPMSRYAAKTGGGKGEVFSHLPLLQPPGRMGRLAADSVACSLCHQIQPEGLGSEQSFTAGFVIAQGTAAKGREAFGPYEVDQGRKRIMRSATRLTPTRSEHIQDAALCGSCHTLYTHALGEKGEIVGTLPEQTPYLEWQHSAFSQTQSCQNCHMPQLGEPMAISSVLGEERENFSRHVFRGGNFLMPIIFNANRAKLAVTAPAGALRLAAEETRENLQEDAAGLAVTQAVQRSDRVEISVRIDNLSGHKLPTAYPSRRVWLNLKVLDTNGEVVFESGGLRRNGSIAGNDNDRDPHLYEPHYEQINTADQVQIYEPILMDPQERVTTGLLSAVGYIKDNRLLPVGFDKKSAGEDIAVYGKADSDGDFQGGGDIVEYRLPVEGDGQWDRVEVRLYYQPIGFRWAHNLEPYRGEEIVDFVSAYRSFSDRSAIVMAHAAAIIR